MHSMVERVLLRLHSLVGCFGVSASAPVVTCEFVMVDELIDDFNYLTTEGEAAAHRATKTEPRQASPLTVIPEPREAIRVEFSMGLSAMMDVYTNLITRRYWLAAYRIGVYDKNARAVASGRLVALPACDPGNVVAGAFALFCAHFGDDFERSPRLLGGAVARTDDGHLGLTTRMRLAACLATAYKFARGTDSYFGRQFYDSDPDLASPHTRELAFVGFSFFYAAEQQRFGPFDATNGPQTKGMYKHLLAVEADLVCGDRCAVFTSCTRNAQLQAEDRLERMFADRAIGSWELLEVREFVPIFFRALVVPRSGPAQSQGPVAVGAMVLAAFACRLACPTDAAPPVLDVATRFTEAEQVGALEMLHVVLRSDAFTRDALLRDVAREQDVRKALRMLERAISATVTVLGEPAP